MRSIVLISIFVCVTTSPLADKVFDLLTFPQAHQWLHPRQTGDSNSPRCFNNLPGGRIPNNFTFPQWFVLTNTSTILDGEYTLSQPLLVNAHFCTWQANKYNQPPLSFNNSCPVLSEDCRPRHHNFTNSQNTPYLGMFRGWNNSYGFSDTIRINVNISNYNYKDNAGYVDIKLQSGSTVHIQCTNDSSPEQLKLSRSVLPWNFDPNREPIYCFANVTTGNNSYIDFVGVLPPFVAELAFDRTGSIYINGYNYYQAPPIYSIDFKLNYNSTGEAQYKDIDFSYTWLNYTRVHLSSSGGVITKIKYCDSDLNNLACDMNVFDLSDGVYSYSSREALDIPQTFVALPVYANHSYVTIRTVYWVGGCLNCAPSGYTLNIDGAVNNTYCINSKQFTVLLNTTQHATYPEYFKTRFQAGTCPFTFPNINNYLTFGTICISTVDNGGCTIYVQKVWANTVITFGTYYVSYQEGNNIHSMPTASTGTTDISTVHLDVCSKYNIYGKTGVGIIRLTNQSYISGLYYTSLSGDLLAYKNVTTQKIYSVTPCRPSSQVAVYNGSIIAAFTSTENVTITNLTHKVVTPMFYYHSIGNETCDNPAVSFGSIGVCSGGGLHFVDSASGATTSVSPISTTNISIPLNFTVSIQTEYIQIEQQPVTVDCRQYVCNGNERCLQLLLQYTSACSSIEQALSLNARLEAADIQSMLTYSPQTLQLANISNFQSSDVNYNLSAVLPKQYQGRSPIEDILFDKVITNGLGTVDQDYKSCTNGLSVADLACAQYYNGIMVLPGVADPEKMAMYTASLTGGMVFGGLTAAAAVPFSLAVQSRLNYVALQTDVLQQNQKILADSFNNAIGNISLAFKEVSEGISQISGAVTTVANALTKIQTVVNSQGQALATLTEQLANNFQAISASIADIYNRLNQLEADAQVDRLITGRLAALNAFVTQTLSKLAEVRQARQLAQDKINECVKAQSSRYGFCGNGTHLFSVVNSAPHGFVFFHTVLLPTKFTTVVAYSGICHNGKALALRDPTMSLFKNNDDYLLTPRNMYQPRKAVMSDFVYIESCTVTYLNLTDTTIEAVIPDYVDVNKTLEDILNKLPNYTIPDLGVGQYNNTILNLTSEIDDLNRRAENLTDIVKNLQHYIDNINATIVDLEWLNRVETYIKWPWWVWLLIILAIATFACIVITIFLCTGCCGGCFGCFGGCFGLFRRKPRLEDTNPTPVSFKVKEW
uniref:Spike glycoprotein n=1 Tax=Bird deltacoronavirus ArenariaCN24 TaxID=3237948 RepID=A0AB39AFP2_9NIDO